MTAAGNERLLREALAHKGNEEPGTRLTIDVKNRDGGRLGQLVCVDRGLAADSRVIDDLTQWRQTYMEYFLTQFEATAPRTRSWLERVVIPAADRVLFLIVLESGEAVGNFGVCNLTAEAGELDNLIRGRKGGDPRLIYYCELALLSWMFGHLGLKRAMLHVFSNNRPTIRLHSSVGFSESASTSLSLVRSPGQITYLQNSPEGDPVDFRYLEFTLTREEFLVTHPWLPGIYPQHWQAFSS